MPWGPVSKMSKRSQRGTCQQQQQPAAERQESQPTNVGHTEPKPTQHTSENLDDHKRTMTSQTRKRPRLGQPAGESVQNVDERSDEPKLLEQQEMIDFPKGELVQELRNSMRRGRAQQHKPQATSSSPQPPTQRSDLDQPDAPRRQSPRPLTAANASPTPCIKQNICAACKRPIRERYLLMALDKHWHEDCLKCACCDCRLGEVGSSLFTHSDKILCRRDFLRIFGQHGYCAACKRSIPPYELVMRANELAYHMDCFACQQCQYRFCVGDRFYLAEAHKIICLRCQSEQQPQQQQPLATTTTSHFTYDRNHLQPNSGCATPTTGPTTLSRLNAEGPTVCPQANGKRPNDTFGGPEDGETKLTSRDDQPEGQLDDGSGASQTEAEQVQSKLPPQQAAAGALQPGDQKQACAV